MLLMTIFAGIGLILAIVGVYGVISYSVMERTYEIGIRMALGASGRDVLGLVIRRGMLLAAVGIVVGLGGALTVSRLLTSLLFEVSATDLTIYVLLPALLAIVALAACLVPARRATKVDPIVALRYE
jgi:putative ABC transport system permease protein